MKIMIDIIDYVEANIHDDLTVETVASFSGYSSHHFQKMFTAVLGLSLGMYLRKRRLSIAAIRLRTSTVRIIDLALESGFNSQAAFTRSFKDLFGINPSEYRKSTCEIGLRKLHAADGQLIKHLQQGGVIMRPRYETKDKFCVMGVGKVFEPGQTTDIADLLWPRLIQQLPAIPNIRGTQREGCITYGICSELWKEHILQIQFNYYAGVEVDPASVPLPGMELIYTPKQEYAVFTHTTGLQNLHLTNQHIWGTWLPQSGHALASASALEVYPAAFQPSKYNDTLEIWIPLQAKPQTFTSEN